VQALPRLLILGTAVSLALASAHARPWTTARTEHFELLSDASESESRELLGKLEQFRAVVLRLFPLKQAREPRVSVVLFASDRQFTPYKPRYKGKPRDAAAIFSGWPDEAVIAMTTEYTMDITLRIVFHEYIHFLLHARGDFVPPWFDEGFAELFSTFSIRGDKFEIGRPIPEHVDVLRLNKFALGRLFAVRHEDAVYHMGDKVFYAESWGLLHFLMFGSHREAYLPKLARFLEATSAPDAIIDRSFNQAFGMSYDQMEDELRDYVFHGHCAISGGKLPLGDYSARIQFRPASDFERDVALLDLRWRLQESGGVAYELRQLAAAHPESPRPHEILAAIAEHDGDSAGAAEHWAKAAGLGSENSYPYVRLANNTLDQLLTGLSLDYRLPPALAEKLRGWLDRAVALTPDDAEANEALALVEALSGQPRVRVVNHVQALVPQMRDTSRTLLALALIRLQTKDYATCAKITAALRASPRVPPDIKSVASQIDRRVASLAAEPAGDAAGGEAPPPGSADH